MKSSPQTVLVVAAHPDDEVLGCGGTMARHARSGDRVYIQFLSDGISSRDGDEAERADVLRQRRKAAQAAADVLGAQAPQFQDFPDNRLDSVPLLDLVKVIERAIADANPTIVYTHHSGDLNIDHRCVFQAVRTACRPLPGTRIQGLYAFEVLSSTEWSPASAAQAFLPNQFIDISAEFDLKLAALACYKNEIPPSPHARSLDAITALATLRGASAGLAKAEAFDVVYSIL